MGYQLVIGYNPQQEETGATDASRYLTLDLQTSKRAQASSTICSMPIQSGETISDHMYRNPTTVTVSGSFGILSGERFSKDARKKYGDSIEWYDYNERGGIDRLTNVESIFEDIKNRGFLCTLMTMSDNNEESFRFRQRKNMVLRDISWEEMENTVKYEFTFFEAIIVNASNTYNMPEAERSKLGLPNVKTLEGVSLSEVMNQSGDIALSVLLALLNNGIIDKEFLERIAYSRTGAYTYGTLAALCGLVAWGALGVGAGILGAAATGTGVVASIAAGAASTGVGAIVVAGVALVLGVTLGIIAIVRKAKAAEQFGNAWNALQKVKNASDEEKATTINRILESVQLQFLGFKSNVTIYNFPDNQECEALIKIGGDIYKITASKNHIINPAYDCPWSFKVELASQKPLNYVRNIKDIFQTTYVTNEYENYAGQGTTTFGTKSLNCTPPTNYADLNFLTNGWFSSNDGQYQVFLTNVALGLDEEYNKIFDNTPKNKLDDSIISQDIMKVALTKNQRNILSDLRNYQIVVCKGNMKTEYNRITNAVFDALKAYEE